MARTRRIRRKNKKLKGGGFVHPLYCQHSSSCKNPVVRGEIFCTAHSETVPNRKSLSGSEPEYDPGIYNFNKFIRISHNCFAYAMNVLDSLKIKGCKEKNDCHFHAPGIRTGHTPVDKKSCSEIVSRTMADVKGYLTNFPTPCNPGYSKVGIVVDEVNDFHYYRQDSNGWWSHKPGGRAVTNKDAVGARIYRPDLASRYYPPDSNNDSGLNYNSFCSYICVPRKTTSTSADNSGKNSAPIQIAGRRTRKRY